MSLLSHSLPPPLKACAPSRCCLRAFPLWVLLASLAAWQWPGGFTPLKPLIVPGLGAIMFSMGLSLQPADFLRVGRYPRAVLCGLLGQFLIMPALACFIGWALALPPELRLGFIILGACPGGTASNVITWLAGADVALSVTMTACSTLLSVILTPLIVLLLGGCYLPIAPLALFLSVVKMVLIPVAAGLLTRALLQDRLRTLRAFLPAVAMGIIALIIAVIVAGLHGRLLLLTPLCLAGVVLHNLAGLGLGYLLATFFSLPRAMRQTVAIEVGMQNSGLGVALALSHFTLPVAAPASFFSVAHNLSGSLLAACWRKEKAD